MKKKVKQFKIYSLRAKDSDLVEYVGVTSTYLSSRLSQHVYNSKNKKTISAKWISTLKDRPIIELIENVTEQTWEEKEIYWIAYYKAINPKLKNQKKRWKSCVSGRR